MRDPREVILFLHLPKTAGSTVQFFLDRQFDPAQVCTLQPHWADPFAEFAKLPAEVRRQFRLIKGHMQFGIHEYIHRPSRYVTLLRHPVDRLVSYYYYVQTQPNHYLYRAMGGARMSLEAFVTSDLTPELDNDQVRYLAARKAVPVGALTASDLRQAQDNLRRHFAVVGVQDDVSGFLDAMCRRFGLHNVAVPAQNVTQHRPALGEVPPVVRQRILERNALDVELYAFVKDTLAPHRARRLVRRLLSCFAR